MKNDASINDQAYWDRRFREDWETMSGPRQSRFFAELALENLPQWLFDLARRGGYTLADWGCAQGDGTELLASCLQGVQVTGVDFSATAIEQARARYPALRFDASDWLSGTGSGAADYDIVFSSNTLEHFHQPLDVLDRIAPRASKAVVLALPYRELDRHEEHFFTFLPHNVPAVLANGYRLVWAKVVDCRPLPDTMWPGQQVFLVYANPQWLDAGMRLALKDCRVEPEGARVDVVVRELDHSREELVALQGTLDARTQELGAARSELQQRAEEARALDEQVRGLNQQLQGLTLQLQGVNQQLQAREEQLLAATQQLQARDAEMQQRAEQLQGVEQQLQARDEQIRAREAEVTRLNRLLADRNDQVRVLSALEIEQRTQAEQAQAALEALRQQNARLQTDVMSNRQELQRVSDWASGIAAHPATYAIKRNSYLIATGLYRRLPISPEGKQKIKRLAFGLAGRGDAPQAQPPAQPERIEAPATHKITPYQGERDVFVFAVIDWHFRIQRPQHIARGLAQLGRRVFFFSNVFVDSDQPGYELERLDPELQLFQVKLHVKGAPQIYFAPASDTVVRMLQASLGRFIADFGALSSVSIVQHAFWFPLVKTVPNSLRLYDCMDHHEGFGNVPAELVRIEQEMLRRSDLVLVTSGWLEEFAGAHNRNVAMVRNAVEYDFFAAPPATVFKDKTGRRIIGYYGAIAEWFDIALVRAIAVRFPDCLVLLVGSDTVDAAKQLKDLPNVQFTGEVPYRELPHYLYAFDVCLLPFLVSSLTLATNPVKVYEYLAAGKPVVCVDLPEIAQFGGLVAKAPDAAAFVERVGEALAQEQTAEVVAARRAFAADQTWRHRAASVDAALRGLRLPRISVIVLTYNNLELTKACLGSLLLESDYPDLELILVDNASTDGSPDYLRAFAHRHPGTVLLLNEKNLGFSAGNNVGLAAATGEYLVILNNDTVVTRGWAMNLLRHLQEDPAIGVIGPLANNIGNAARVTTSYTAIEDMPSEAYSLTLARTGSNFPLRTAAFFCVMFHRAVYDAVGPMDEAFGRGFFEDDDYCRRVEREGLKVVCAEDAFVHHHLSASFNKLPTAERQALFDQNKATYERKWGPWVAHTYSREYQPEIATVRDLPPELPGETPRRRFVVGHCTVCGGTGRFFYTERVRWRETLTCEHCRSTSRYRSISRGILRAVREIADVEAGALAMLPRSGVKRTLRAYDTQPPFSYATCAYPLPELLGRTDWIELALSQYKPELPPGAEIRPGVQNQNLERLTFADASLDLVITSDVMEHVRLDDQAHREIHRVLRMGGAYVFTVPHQMDMERTLARVRVKEPDNAAADELLMEPEYHGDTNGEGEGVLAYRLYGRDLVDQLEGIGFEVHYTRDDLPEQGILATELFYCRKVRA